LLRCSILLLVIAGLGVMAVSLAFVDVVPRRSITPSAMSETSVRIEMCFQRHKRLPPGAHAAGRRVPPAPFRKTAGRPRQSAQKELRQSARDADFFASIFRAF
jgi:hypothetical protein